MLIVLAGKSLNGVQNTYPATPILETNFVENQFTATVRTKSVDRDSRLEIIRNKIAAGATIYSQDTFFEGDTIAASSSDMSDLTAPQLCSDYTTYQGFWDIRQVSVSVESDARVVTLSEAASSTESKLLLKLPVSTVGLGAQNCIATDVIGITPAGALIRNGDAVFYRGVDDSILLGYALDGYPIYGTSNKSTDQCGGISDNGQYQYVLSSERETMLNCFAGSPVRL